jgi:undecaprenyl-diphosphatase
MGDLLTVGQAVLLGLVQGLTEFLPVSSSGHLALAQAYLGIEGSSIAVAVLLHAGTLLAISLVFRAGVLRLVRGGLDLLRHPLAGPAGWSADAVLAAKIVCATVPGAVVGLALESRVEAAFGDPRLVAGLLLGTAAILLFSRIRRPGGSDVGWRHAWLIGLAQAVAILPGISRSGTTITVALLLGIARPAAAEFSFLAAIPLILGSLVLNLPELERNAAGGETVALVLGFLTSFVVGWAALVWLIRLVRRGQLHWFAIYCAAVALVVFLWPPA